MIQVFIFPSVCPKQLFFIRIANSQWFCFFEGVSLLHSPHCTYCHSLLSARHHGEDKPTPLHLLFAQPNSKIIQYSWQYCLSQYACASTNARCKCKPDTFSSSKALYICSVVQQTFLLVSCMLSLNFRLQYSGPVTITSN